MPDYGQTITKGVKYLKINKIDANGDDFGQKLALADNIRINYPDVGAVQYNILTTQQQGNVYLMGLVPQETTSSEGRFGFGIQADKTYSVLSSTPKWGGDQDTKEYFFGMGANISDDAYDFWTQGTNGSSLSNASNYEFRRSSNEKLYLQVTCSIDNPQSIENVDLDIRLSIKPLNESEFFVDLDTLTVPLSSGATSSIFYEIPQEYTVQGTIFGLIADATYGISPAVSPLTASYAEFNIRAEAIDAPPRTLLNISPETSNFEYSDYNAIFGNASTPQFSGIFQDIDYADNYITPINFELIVSGSARKAQVQDSNYTQTGWINGRYNGSRNSSTDFNK